ncbi:ABC transporter substrate-binding protein [Nonomuraea sp. NPDC050783]|uniref:ABC transporter substrate-binding protein n=1 Tax=Nonomuraea sp. NPDC050783 TaxID=3154634 RepID=UPI0034659070
MDLAQSAGSRLMFAAMALIVSTTVAACGGSPTEVPAAPTIDPAKLISSLPAAKGDVDNVVWNLTAGEPDTLDPRNAANYSSGQIVKNVCDSLLAVKPDFSTGPGLATLDQRSPTELVFTLRDGITFSDGTPVTADDVVYSLKRSADPASVVSFVFLYVEAIKKTGDKEVTVTFKQPDALFAGGMATISGAVVKKEWAERARENVGTPSGGLVCSGPFTLGEWRSGSGLTLKRNDSYWNKELRPFAKQVAFTFVTDATAVARALDAGEIDGAYELPVTAVPSLRKSQKGRLVFGPSTQSVSLGVARPDGPLADNKLRQALQRAVDREGLAKVVFQGAAEANYTLLPPATWPNAQRDLYRAAYDKYVKERAYDINAAKTLVQGSSYKGEPVVLATMAGDETMSRTAQLVQQQAKAIGVTIKIQTMQPLVWAEAGYDASKRQGVDLMLSSNFNAGQNPLEPLGFDLLPGQPYNYTEYDNAEVTKLLTEARQTLDPVESAQKIIKAQEIYEPNASTVPLLSTNTITFLNHRLTGAVTSFAYWSMPQMAYVGAAG